MRRALALIAVTLFAAVSASATCEFAVTSRVNDGRIHLTWNPVPGATHYRVFEVQNVHFQGERSGDSALVTDTRLTVRRQVLRQTTFGFFVYAEKPGDPAFSACVGETLVQLQPDLELLRQSRRTIVPLVGSTVGANGARFKTSLRLRKPTTRGTMYFRPVGTTPSAADPSLRYDLTRDETVEVYYDDVVAAMGASGLGSLEFVPDDNLQSTVILDVRVYNETPTGTFGSSEIGVTPYDWLYYRDTVSSSGMIEAAPTTDRFRRNIGLRAITTVAFRVSMQRADGTTYSMPGEIQLPADYTLFGSVEQLLGVPVSSADRVFLNVTAGYGIPFYTTTENSTNDPTIFIGLPTRFESRDILSR